MATAEMTCGGVGCGLIAPRAHKCLHRLRALGAAAEWQQKQQLRRTSKAKKSESNPSIQRNSPADFANAALPASGRAPNPGPLEIQLHCSKGGA